MGSPRKQHLIDPEICIRCYTCENTCPIEAITHDDNNVVVDADKCNYCMDCVPVCPTGSIDNWRVVTTPFTLDEQFEWEELPDQEEITSDKSDASIEAIDESIAALLAQAHAGAGGVARAPASAAKPTVNLYTISKPVTGTLKGNFKLTSESADSDVRHLIVDMGAAPFPVLEGQSVGVIAPGIDVHGKAHLPRLYSVSSPRDGERPNYNNLSLTVKREESGVCSNYLCDLDKGAEIQLTGPFGSTFLMPSDAKARILMICTGTGSAPFRAFTMHRERTVEKPESPMVLVFGARTPESLPYFGPLNKVPEELLEKYLVYSRVEGEPKRYVQDALRENHEQIAALISDPDACIYICGLKAMEEGVDQALAEIASGIDLDWKALRDIMRADGRYHIETY